MAATRKLIALCGNDIIKKIELKALMKLHETCILATLLTNCETWVLNIGERDKIQKIELWALKKILSVPVTTPTPAIWFATGFLLTPVLIDKRQLLYLKTLLDRPHGTSWEKISKNTYISWKNCVLTATEKRNKELLVDMCVNMQKRGKNKD